MANPPLPNAPAPRPQWSSAESLRLIDAGAALRRNPFHGQQQAQVLTCQIGSSLKVDRRRRAEVAATEIGQCLGNEQPDLKGAFDILKRWYRHASSRPPKPSRQDLQKISKECEALCKRRVQVGAPIPSHVEPFPINDETPTECEIRKAVGKMKRGKATGPTGVHAEDFKDWLRAACPPETEGAPAPDRTC